ncbi:hypothetical protein [Natronomonas sp.]|uniref:hypothetical protein n=1 Tax=Natronomonas sp. TaxID=2184060 RepID=UPI0039769AB5
MHRRSLFGALGSSVFAGVAGCTTFDSKRELVEEERTIDPADSALSAREFQTAAAEMHEGHAAGGVWGRDQTAIDHELDFEGAWSATLSHHDGTESDHLLAMYALPPAPEGTRSSQVWLWSGVDPSDGTSVHRLSTGISLPEPDFSLGIYSPAQDYDAEDVSSYRVEGGRLDAATLAATMPLSNGRIGIDERTQIGDGGAYALEWTGESETLQSLAATTEVRWLADTDGEVVWTVAAETSR